MPETAEKKEKARLQRTKVRAVVKRSNAINRIRAIHALSLSVSTRPEEVAKFLVAAADLDKLWAEFEREDESVLDCLILLDSSAEYSCALPAEIRELVNACKAVVNNVSPACSAESCEAVPPVVNRFSRLPDIPMPSYGGDLSGWPVFRDRYTALIVDRPELSNIERFYYLLGCLTGDALDSIKHIPVSDVTYDLAWSTLNKRFNKPRELATIIVDKLLTAPVHAQESLDGLKSFLTLFSDQVSVLKSLNIPSLGDFMLFALSSRCLPPSTRKAFEETNQTEFPVFSEIVSYVKGRVELLDSITCSDVSKRPTSADDQSKPTTSRFGSKTNTKVTSMATKSKSPVPVKCLFCSGKHSSVSCTQFSRLSLDDRYETTRKNKVCFRCLNSTHWSTHCKLIKSCIKCSGRHHTLLHREVEPSSSNTSNVSVTSLVSSMNKTTVLLGTAVVRVRDCDGYMQPARALIDSASQISAMSIACVDRLGLKKSRWTAPLTGLSGVPIPTVSGSVDCFVTPRHADDPPTFHLNMWIMPKIVANMPSRDLPASLKSEFSHLALADPQFDRSAPIDLLLGADVFARIMNGKRVSIHDTLPVAYGSLFGWIIIGALSHQDYQSLSSTVSLEDVFQRLKNVI